MLCDLSELTIETNYNFRLQRLGVRTSKKVDFSSKNQKTSVTLIIDSLVINGDFSLEKYLLRQVMLTEVIKHFYASGVYNFPIHRAYTSATHLLLFYETICNLDIRVCVRK